MGRWVGWCVCVCVFVCLSVCVCVCDVKYASGYVIEGDLSLSQMNTLLHKVPVTNMDYL